MPEDSNAVPLYEVVKSHILDRIHSGDLTPGSKVPSEHELVKEFGVSRMTANRSLKELAAEGLLTRIAGVGTFVAQAQTTGHLLEVKSVATDIEARGHTYSKHVLTHGRARPPRPISQWMKIDSRANAFHTVIVHMENGVPIQLEDRYVSPHGAPIYADIDLDAQTPTGFLLENVPLQRVEHTVRAISASADICNQLLMQRETPCLLLERRTWSREIPVSHVRLYHSGDRYALSDTFVPREIKE